MGSVLLNLKLFGPELALVGLLVALFLVDAFLPKSRESFLPLSLVALTCAFAAYVTFQLNVAPVTFFNGLVANDGFTAFFRYLFLFTLVAGLYLAYGSKEVPKEARIEMTLLLVCVTFGMS